MILRVYARARDALDCKLRISFFLPFLGLRVFGRNVLHKAGISILYSFDATCSDHPRSQLYRARGVLGRSGKMEKRDDAMREKIELGRDIHDDESRTGAALDRNSLFA